MNTNWLLNFITIALLLVACQEDEFVDNFIEEYDSEVFKEFIGYTL